MSGVPRKGRRPGPLTLRVLFEHSVAKDERTPNEDRWARSEDGTVCALSDGASVSFDPAAWAELLVGRFVRDPRIDASWIAAAAAEFAQRYDRDALSWSAQAAIDRGSYATLMGVRPSDDQSSVEIFGLGDSLAVWLDGHRIIATFPYEDPAQFQRSPVLVGTEPRENAVFSDPALRECIASYPVPVDGCPTLMLMTDALGAWLLERRDDEAAGRLLALDSSDSFEQFVISERSGGWLKRDDTTLIIMGLPDELPADH